MNHTIDHQHMNIVTIFNFPGNPHGQTKANIFKLILPELYLELNYQQFLHERYIKPGVSNVKISICTEKYKYFCNI